MWLWGKIKFYLVAAVSIAAIVFTALLKGRRQGRKQERDKQVANAAAKQTKAAEVKREVREEINGSGSGVSADRLRTDWVRDDPDDPV